MKILEKVPNGLQSIIEVYGNPDADGDGILDVQWAKDNLKIFTFPFPMRKSWGAHELVTKFQAHRLVGDAIADALDEFFNAMGSVEIRAKTWDYWGGCFNFRANANARDRLSTHSWGIAVDLNPHLNPNGQKECKQPTELVRAFISRGFRWVPNDWMHTQAAWGY
jgi:hypothetical protein